jgi:parallel beta-helix repeat protein
LVSVVLVSLPQNVTVKAAPKTITVPDDYESIQEAIDNADDGDTIFVESGTYVETLTVTKSVSLIGEDSVNTVVDGNKTYACHVIEVTASNVQITGFTIQNSGGVKYYERAGIYVESSNGNNISGNIVTDNYGNGVYLTESSSNNVVSRNNITANFLSGVAITKLSNNNTVEGNTLTDNFCGISVAYSSNQHIHDNVVGNSGNHGINLDDSSSNLIVGNTVADCHNFGLHVYRSSSNRICENVLTNNVKGIRLSSSDNNTVSQNNMTNNEHGIAISASSNNLIFENIVSGNDIGVLLSSINPLNNTVWNNDFVDNTKQVLDDASGAILLWDNGTIGNFWSDYGGLDSDGDGVGDTPYIIDDHNQDNCPLVQPAIIPEFPQWMLLLVLTCFIVGLMTFYRRSLTKCSQRGSNP